jgi:hypothetical protein
MPSVWTTVHVALGQPETRRAGLAGRAPYHTGSATTSASLTES